MSDLGVTSTPSQTGERFLRNREKWTPYEEEQLLMLYAEAEANPARKYFWCNKWRANPVYYVAKKLGRTPCAVSGRRYALMQCAKRKDCEPETGRRIELGKE